MKNLFLLTVFSLFIVSASFASGATKNKEDIPSQPRSTKRGYFGMVEISQGLVMSTNGVYRTSLHIINGYRIFPQLSVGLGIGMKMFPGSRPSVLSGLNDDNFHKGKTDIALPLFVHVRTDMLKNAKTSPYFALNAGYNVSLNKGFFRGYLIEPALGVGIGLGKRGNQLNIGVGYQMHETKMRVRVPKLGYGGSIHGYVWKNKSEMKGAINITIGFMW